MSRDFEGAKRWLEQLPERVIACAPDGRIVWVNSLAAFLLGRSEQELAGQALDELVVDEREPVLPRLHGLSRGEGLQCCLRHRTGTQLHVDLASAGFVDELAVVVVRPTRPEVQQDARARTHELVFEGAPVGIFHFDAQGAVTACNDAFVKILGSPRRVLLGVRIDTLPDPVMKRCMLDTLAGERAHYDGEYQSATSGQVRAVRVDFAPIFGTDGAVIGGVGIAEDVTERKALEARLAVADRLASVGTLAAGIAHEINNPLAYVMLNLELLAKDPDLRAISRTAVERAREGSERVRVIIRDLRIFSRIEEDRRVPVDVRDAIESALNLAKSELSARARLVRETAVVPPVLGDEARLTQVILNLVVNAAQAIPEGDPNRHTITVRSGVRAGWVEISVTDTGVGIPPDLLPRIFEPFWTTKPVGVGTGLGLSIVHGIVGGLGGRIEVVSEPHVGTTFRVLLPPGPTTAPGDTPVLEDHPAVAPARILVIDDEHHFSEALRATLSRHHEVVVEPGGHAGVARLLRDDAFDLVICDLMMPELGGIGVLEAVREARPALVSRFAVMTGGAYDDEARGLFERLGVRVLDKPFELTEIDRLLARRA